jgi:membrane protease YdiL (CAAX protease family)/GNAT superfamily N-acetyltransferase
MTFEMRPMDDISFSENPSVGDDELNALFERSWPSHTRRSFQPVLARSLTYIVARQGDRLVGYVNLATDGGVHAFLLDTTVDPDFRERGIGSALIQRAIAAAGRKRMGWVHVDFDEKHDILYRRAGFQPTLAGLVKLSPVTTTPAPVVQQIVAPPPPPPPPAPQPSPESVDRPRTSSPFERLRARGLLVQCFFGAALLIAAARLILGPNAVGVDDSGMFALFYLGGGLVLAYRAAKAGVNAERLFGPRPSAAMLRLCIVAIPLGLLAIAGFWLLFLPLSFVAPDFVRTWAIENMNKVPVRTLPLWAAQFCVAVLIAPPVEELLFRGILMHRWARKWGTTTGVIASSALFALGHVELLGHFVFGVAMCALYLRTKSLWVPIATHALNNFIASSVELAGVLRPDKKGEEMSLLTLRSQWWVGLLLLVVALTLLEAYRRKFWRGVDLRALLAGPVPYES